jgi:hypothetical protein
VTARFPKSSFLWRGALLLTGVLFWVTCDVGYPEVVIVNRTAEYILLQNIGFNGCVWNTVLAFGESTSPGRCLPGADRIHFEKFDAQSYCMEQTEDGAMDGICLCNGDTDTGSQSNEMDDGLTNREPRWFNYQTLSVKKVDYGEFDIFEITMDDMEQDFSIPGPYGH